MYSHEEFMHDVQNSIGKTSQKQMVAAFVGSLSTRNMLARCAFSSYVLIRHMPDHTFDATEVFEMQTCEICGEYAQSKSAPPSAERINTNPGCMSMELRYAPVVLQAYLDQPLIEPTGEDAEILKRVLGALREIPADCTRLTDLRKAIQKLFKANDRQRTVFLETLGFCGILCPSDKTHFTYEYVNKDIDDSSQPSQFNKRDWAYPVRWWEGSDGVNEAMVEYWFGEYL